MVYQMPYIELDDLAVKLSFEGIGIKKLALILIGGGVLAVFAISGFQAKSLFRESVTEEATVQLKQGDNCIVEGSDRVPRTIGNCAYNLGDILSITYKPGQPAIEKHVFVRASSE